LAAKFAPIAKDLTEKENLIIQELLAVQGNPVDIQGYYYPNRELTSAAMRPSATFNRILDSLI
jgi:isocitrate dehydrogenase